LGPCSNRELQRQLGDTSGSFSEIWPSAERRPECWWLHDW
jgi:hypothetical protein